MWTCALGEWCITSWAYLRRVWHRLGGACIVRNRSEVESSKVCGAGQNGAEGHVWRVTQNWSGLVAAL